VSASIAIVGAGGMLGHDLVRELPDALALTRAELDVTDDEAVREALGGVETVINCAAWTDVDGAEEHEAEAMRVNRDGARNVAAAARRVVYVSTDYVFDGSADEPYEPGDQTNPLQAYGRTKLAGEHASAEANPDHFIVRSSWLFGVGGRNFADTILRLAGERDSLRVVDDQIGCPTFTGHLARSIRQLIEGDRYGIHHRAAAGQCSWFEFASFLVERERLDCRVEPCTTQEFPRPATRPAYSVLRPGPLPDWQKGAAEYLVERKVRA
jgi:dTDP-4-dehydrorhamnose reductase